jgi:hypothetical protein
LCPAACPRPTTTTAYTMRRHPLAPFIVALLALSPTAVGATNSFIKSSREGSWVPPRETSPAEYHGQMALGWSPMPTGAPKALFGRMEILPRQATLDTRTCAYVSTNGRKSHIPRKAYPQEKQQLTVAKFPTPVSNRRPLAPTQATTSDAARRAITAITSSPRASTTTLSWGTSVSS